MTRKRNSRFAPAYPMALYTAPEHTQPPQQVIVVSEPPMPQLTGSLTAAEHAIVRDRYFEQKEFAQIVGDQNERVLFELAEAFKTLSARD